MADWDKRSAKQLTKLQDELVRAQVRAVASSSAWWKQRFAALGQSAAKLEGVDNLAALPAAGERDISPTGDAAPMSGLVLHGGEQMFALHAAGPQLRRAMRLRLARSHHYHRIVHEETRPTSYVWSGLGFRYPLASTRGDLDAIARAGARLWRVLGLTQDDALLSAMPVASTTEHVALQYAALAAGAPAVFPGNDPAAVMAAARLAHPTVVAARVTSAPDVVAALAQVDAVDRLRTVLLVGAPTDEERVSATEALHDAGVTGAVVLAVHAPAGARVLWGECRESEGSTGLHTYPDLEVVQVVDPDTAEPSTSGGEVVLTQLRMRGSALLRWRTGDVVEAVETTPCRGCGRTVPRVVGLRRHALVVMTETGRALDIRAVTGALVGRADVDDWRVVLGRRSRDGRGQVVVHLVPHADNDEAVVGAAADIRASAGMLPSQLVLSTPDDLAAIGGEHVTARVLARR